MKKIFLLLPAILLTGCMKTMVVKMDFPEVPEEIKQECSDLKQTPENETKFSKVIEVVVENYSLYHECKLKNEAWNEWYKQQKQISDSIK